jgi:hypothetical protein
VTKKLPHGMATGAGILPPTVFRVVMAYDDFASGKRAMNTCDYLVSQFGGGVELRSSMWKFDVLRHTKLNQMAVDDAIEADVIIVANSRNGELPEEVTRWVDQWARRKQGHATALVALLDFTGQNSGPSARALAFLKTAAHRAKMDFLPRQIRTSAGRLFPLTSASFNLGPPPSTAAATPPAPPAEGSGIND